MFEPENKEKKLHKCFYCEAETTHPDSKCHLAPQPNKGLTTRQVLAMAAAYPFVIVEIQRFWQPENGIKHLAFNTKCSFKIAELLEKNIDGLETSTFNFIRPCSFQEYITNKRSRLFELNSY